MSTRRPHCLWSICKPSIGSRALVLTFHLNVFNCAGRSVHFKIIFGRCQGRWTGQNALTWNTGQVFGRLLQVWYFVNHLLQHLLLICLPTCANKLLQRRLELGRSSLWAVERSLWSSCWGPYWQCSSNAPSSWTSGPHSSFLSRNRGNKPWHHKSWPGSLLREAAW